MTTGTKKLVDLASCGSLFSFALATVVLPMSLVNVRQELGLSLTQAGTMSLTISIVELCVLLLAIPLAASLGKIRLLRLGLFILALGLVLFTRAGLYLAALGAVFVIALGQGFQEALVAPLVADVYPDDNGSHQSRVHMFWPLGIMLGTLVFGESLTRSASWRPLFYSVAIMAAGIALLYPRSSRVQPPRVPNKAFRIGTLLKSGRFWCMGLAIFFAGSTEGGLTFWMASYIQIEYGALPRAAGFGTAVFAGGMAAGRLLMSRLTARIPVYRIVMIAAIGLSVAGSGVYVSRSLPMLFVFMFVSGLASAPPWPGLKTLALQKLSADPTTMMVFLSCMGILGYNWISFFMGVMGDAAGLQASFLLVPASSILMFVVVLLERRIKNPS